VSSWSFSLEPGADTTIALGGVRGRERSVKER
jgi:hypothetical protein